MNILYFSANALNMQIIYKYMWNIIKMYKSKEKDIGMHALKHKHARKGLKRKHFGFFTKLEKKKKNIQTTNKYKISTIEDKIFKVTLLLK